MAGEVSDDAVPVRGLAQTGGVTAELRTIELHGHPMAYRYVQGPAADSPVLVLVHGMAGSSATWLDVMEDLVKFTILVRDRADYLVDRYSERVESAQAVAARVNQRTV